MLIPSSNVNTTSELRIFVLTGFFRFFRRFPQINVDGDSAHLSSFGKHTREPRLARLQKGMLRQLATPLGTFCERARRGSRVRLPKEENARSRHQRLFVKNVGKTEGNVMKNIPDSGFVFTFEEGINTSHVCPKGQ